MVQINQSKLDQIATDEKVLLLLSQGHLDPESESQICELLQKPEINWSALMKESHEQQVFPLIYCNLRGLGFPSVPDGIRRQLAGAYVQNAARNMLLAQELSTVLRMLGESGVPVIPLKGVPLALSLYGDHARRVCGDMDILVPRQFVTKALQVLKQRGYKGLQHPGLERLALRHGIEYGLTRKESEFEYIVELHWGIFLGLPSERAVLPDLWATAIPKVVLSSPAFMLSAEWELLSLAAHAARHQWHGLKWMADIHEIASRAAVDWQQLNRIAVELGWDEILRISLVACHKLYGTPLPPTIRFDHLPQWLRLVPFPQRSDGPAGLAIARRLLKRPREKLAHLAHCLLLPTGAEEAALNLPEFLCFLYYPFRPIRLFWKWGWKVLTGDIIL
jgi:Uncharacterised nucleotidyltransferase